MPPPSVSGSKASTSSEGSDAPAELSVEEVGFFYRSLASARDQIGHVTKTISKEFSIGPRGPWILGIIGQGTISPHELAGSFRVGRSLITAEVDRLTSAGLVRYQKSALDGRRVELSLTPSGLHVWSRLGDEMSLMLGERLKGYSKEEILQCARILHEFSRKP